VTVKVHPVIRVGLRGAKVIMIIVTYPDFVPSPNDLTSLARITREGVCRILRDPSPWFSPLFAPPFFKRVGTQGKALPTGSGGPGEASPALVIGNWSLDIPGLFAKTFANSPG
jgi:hypothetical protein